MDELRLSLLALFVALIAGIYIRERLRRGALSVPGIHPFGAAASRPANANAATFTSAQATEHAARDGAQSARHESEPASNSATRPAAPKRSKRARAHTEVLGSVIESTDTEHADAPDIPLGNIDLLGVSAARVPKFQQGQLDLEAELQRAPQAAGEREPSEVLIIVLHVMRVSAELMAGPDVRAALARANTRFGDMNVYHHHGVGRQAGVHAPVFSIAKAVEPGTFVADDDSSYATPGLTLFMRLPGSQDGAVTLELMFAAAQSLARDLSAQVLDQQRSTLSAQALNHLRDQVAEFARRQRLAAGGAHV
jgi:cell division protein ZipA